MILLVVYGCPPPIFYNYVLTNFKPNEGESLHGRLESYADTDDSFSVHRVMYVCPSNAERTTFLGLLDCYIH